jgi:hypothetical protein
VDRDALGEVLRLDRAVPEAVGQGRRRGCVGHLAVVEVDRAAGRREPVTSEGRARLLVVLRSDCFLRVRLIEDLVEQVMVIGMDVVLEEAAVALQPRPCDDAIATVAPQPERPFRLAPLVLAQTPGDVADVPRCACAEQPPLLEGELSHPFDDLRCRSHG